MVLDSESKNRGHFEVHGDLGRISNRFAANSAHTFSNDINHIADELDIMNTVIETDLQLQLPDFSDHVLNKIADQYQGLSLMEDIVELDLKYDEFTIKGKFYLFYYLSSDEPLYSLSIDYYVDALKQKYSK